MQSGRYLKIIDESTLSDDSSDDWVIRVSDLSKRFDIYSHDRDRLREFFGNRKHHEEHWSLKDLSFEIRPGECFGIIGANGAGKSTLLKIISGITAPTHGQIELKADVSPLLDLGVGFHPSFTGRENIRLNCKLLGMNDSEIINATPKILQFAELGDFIDFPVRTYSSGMQLRLGFSIAAHVPCDLLLIDEVLAVGDQRFQRKCVQRIEEFLADERTIVLVSHDLHAVRSLCNRVLWIDKGEIRMIGAAPEVVDRYIQGGHTGRPTKPQVEQPKAQFSGEVEHFRCTNEDATLKNHLLTFCEQLVVPQDLSPIEPLDVVHGETAIMQGTGEVDILSVHIMDSDAQPRIRFHTGEDLIFAVHFHAKVPIENPIFGVALFRGDDVYIHGPNTKFDQVLDGMYYGVYTFYIRWKDLPLLSGQYEASVAIFDQHHLKPYIWHNRVHQFEVAAPIEDHGTVLLEHDWGMITHRSHPIVEPDQ